MRYITLNSVHGVSPGGAVMLFSVVEMFVCMCRENGISMAHVDNNYVTKRLLVD